MIRISSSGAFKSTTDFLNRVRGGQIYSDLDHYGRLGVQALSSATPVRSGLSASSWAYRVIHGKRPGIEWYNTDTVNGVPVVVLIQYGHGTGTGGYVQGRDFINPAMRGVFDQIADDVWKKVSA